ncbi:ATP-binding protein [Roseateles koreensis]|uniref:histidine kinase n=1 Tax=Roseateles koreensis TaxID=2987526 RepID=A0ABT5KRV7_9BURK|nr:ATP-binding protein [Roseateles koreensis]MDC8785170.1 ATP-binding protein [Roseateles koreensis]
MIVLLLVALGVSALIQGVSAYRTALNETDQIFDYQMLQMAFSLRGGVGRGTVTVPLAQNQSFDFLVQVWSIDGASVFRSPGEFLLPQRALLGFSEVSQGDKRYRIFSLQTPFEVVQVAQDLAVRHRMAGQLAWRTVLPIAWMWPILALLVWWVVSHALTPVSRVSAQLAQRGADDLAPIPADDLPDELQPLLASFNALLVRVSQAFSAQQRFVADAAHELRSPLAALKLQWQALHRADDADARALAIQRLGQGIDRASRLAEQMLQLARQDSPAAKALAPTRVQLGALCREAVVEASDAAQRRSIDLGVSECDAAEVMGQADALQVLVRNLLDNAIKYTPPGGRVDVSLTRQPDGSYCLAIDDSGPGIAADERARVFDPFYRGEGLSNTAGSGLGLAIVKSIVQAHGGQIQLLSSAQLGGLGVRVTLPSIPPTPS